GGGIAALSGLSPSARLAPIPRGARRVVQPTLHAGSLLGDDVVELAADVAEHVVEAVALQRLLAPPLEAIHEVAQAGQVASRRVTRPPAAVHQPPERLRQVAFRHHVVGEGVEDLVGLEIRDVLRSVPPRVARRTRQRIGGGRGVARARSTRAGRPAGPFELGPQIARIRGVRGHRWYTTPPGTRSLLSRRARCRPSRRNSTAEATTAGDSAPSVTSKAPSRVTAPDMPGTSRIHATYSRDGVDSPVSTVNPSSNASTTPS